MWTQVSLILLVPTLTSCNIQRLAKCDVLQPTIWENNNRTCPDRAVCGNVVSQRWKNKDDSPCLKITVTNECFCPGNLACPFDNYDHRLYDRNIIMKLYTCEPVCSIVWCQKEKTDKTPIIAMTMEDDQSPEFGGTIFTKIDCRCAFHHRLSRASENVCQTEMVQGRRGSRDWIHFICWMNEKEKPMTDPCPKRVP